MEACAEHIEYQLPNGHSRVGFLLDAIQCSDAGLQAAMASVKIATAPGGMRSDFEAAASFLLPYDPVAKKRAGKRGASQISALETETTEAMAAVTIGKKKNGIGKTGVHLRYHKAEEYAALNKAQRMELYEYKQQHPEQFKQLKGTGKPNGRRKQQTMKQQIAAALEARDEQQKKQERSEDEAKAYIMSVFDECNRKRASGPATVGAAAAAPVNPSLALNAIMKKARFNP